MCNLAWSKNVNELVSTHGYSQNQIVVWRYPTMSKVFAQADKGGSAHTECVRVRGMEAEDRPADWREPSARSRSTRPCRAHTRRPVARAPSCAPQVATLTGHTLRVLYLALSPDSQTIVTGAGDETLRFWNVFPEAKSQGSSTSVAGLLRTQIR